MKLDPEKIYYLSHPLTSCGDPEENRAKEAVTYINIMLDQQGEFFGINAADNWVKIIRPLAIVPKTYTDAQAMNLCKNLLKICDAIIMAGDWEKSRGCMEELKLAMDMGKKVVWV